VVAAAFFAGMYIFAPGLNIARRTRRFAVVTVAGGAANLVLALLLVGPLGIRGAALSFLATQAAAFGALMVASQRLYPVPHEWGRLALGLGAGVALTAAGWRLPPVAEHLWALPAKLTVGTVAVAAMAALLVGADERAMGRAALLRRLRPA